MSKVINFVLLDYSYRYSRCPPVQLVYWYLSIKLYQIFSQSTVPMHFESAGSDVLYVGNLRIIKKMKTRLPGQHLRHLSRWITTLLFKNFYFYKRIYFKIIIFIMLTSIFWYYLHLYKLESDLKYFYHFVFFIRNYICIYLYINIRTKNIK